MEKFIFTALHVFGNAAKEEVQKSTKGHFSLFSGRCFSALALVAVLCMMSCQSDDEVTENTNDYTTYLSISKADFDLSRDWVNLSEADKNTFIEAKKRMGITFEKNGIAKTKWTSGSQINISDELFGYFIDYIAHTNKVTKKLNLLKWKTPRLKDGIELDYPPTVRANNCVIQSLYYVLQQFGAGTGAYSLGAIDTWVYSNNYYEYSLEYGWGASTTPVLSHYLNGTYVNISYLTNPTASYQYILILPGPPVHVVVFNNFDPSYGIVNYYDPQNNCTGSVALDMVMYTYMATSYNSF
ncbi:MAG: hypothetical protein LBC74_14190 [Planctomycetaceae bacterium]|jgi:hypothetical protein|nr:hypothetical protein [Planctomycetaceae bacterium]